MPRKAKEEGRQRAPKGSRVAQQEVQHTAESLADLEALKKRWAVTGSEVVRRALRESRQRP